jgi:hypothetical protein
MTNRSTIAERLISIFSNDSIILMTDQAHFHLSAIVKNKIFATGQNKIHSSFINGLITVDV